MLPRLRYLNFLKNLVLYNQMKNRKPSRVYDLTKSQVRDNLRRYQVCIADGADCQILFAVYDLRSGQYAPPTPSYSALVIARGLAEVVRGNPSSPVALYPGDFILYCVGRYNTTTGFVTGADSACIGSVRDIVELTTPDDLAAFLNSVDALLASNNVPKSS